MTVQEAATKLGLSIDTVYTLCARGQLRHRRVGPNRGRIQVPEAAIADYLKACEVGPENCPTALAARVSPRTKPGPKPGGRPDGKPIRGHWG